MTTKMPTYPLRLPISIKAEAERLAVTEGTSLNQFVAMAVAEKVAALRTASYFAERRGRADWPEFDRLMAPDGGELPRPGDELPDRVGWALPSSRVASMGWDAPCCSTFVRASVGCPSPCHHTGLVFQEGQAFLEGAAGGEIQGAPAAAEGLDEGDAGDQA